MLLWLGCWLSGRLVSVRSLVVLVVLVVLMVRSLFGLDLLLESF